LSAAAADTIVLVSAEKLNAASPYIIAPVTEASGIIVERGVPRDATEVYDKMGITVARA
jgi:DeoR/GlpR family transcriptional regulator of sugar metabolism